MLGYTDPDGRIAIYRSPTRRRAPDTEFEVRGKVDLPRVDIVLSYAGADGTAVRAFAAAGARAIISTGLAPGLATPAETAALLEARQAGVFVIQASRAGSGRVLPRTALGKQGFVAADNLSPQKARILAMLALTVTSRNCRGCSTSTDRAFPRPVTPRWYEAPSGRLCGPSFRLAPWLCA
jgi:L-asparaginase